MGREGGVENNYVNLGLPQWEYSTFRVHTGTALLWEPGRTHAKGRLNPRNQGKAWTSNFLWFGMMLNKTQQELEYSGQHWQQGGGGVQS
jgi:hypothetical protein